MPDTYTSQFSGEEIDSALRAAQIISGASTLAELRDKLEIRGDTIPVSAADPTPVSEALSASGGGVNPNLLDNWFFGRPVNQRGQTEYTTGGVYTLDRWWMQYDTTLSIVDGGIKIGGKWDVQQYFENTLPNATYTLSLLYKDRTGSDPLRLIAGNRTDGDIAQTESKDASGILSVTFSTATSNRFNFGFAGSTDNSAIIIAIKLELGSSQTLAHKEGDKWVLNEIPDFGEQLRRCQRLAIDGKYYTAVGQLNYDGDTYYVSVQFPCVMRTIPAITLKEISAIGWGALPTSSAEISWNDVNGFFVAIKDLTNINNFIGKSCIVTYFASADL